MTFDIDPLDAVIQYLKANSTLSSLVGGRIAAKHRYGVSWDRGDASLVAKLDSGEPHLYVPIQTARLEMSCFGAKTVEAIGIWKQLVTMSRAADRETVTVANGDQALLYHFLQDSGPSLLYDQDLEMDLVMCFFRATICELKLA